MSEMRTNINIKEFDGDTDNKMKICVVYKFECNLCNADYVGWCTRHLNQHINERKYSAIGRRHLEQHGLLKTDLADKQFSVLCRLS